MMVSVHDGQSLAGSAQEVAQMWEADWAYQPPSGTDTPLHLALVAAMVVLVCVLDICCRVR